MRVTGLLTGPRLSRLGTCCLQSASERSGAFRKKTGQVQSGIVGIRCCRACAKPAREGRRGGKAGPSRGLDHRV